jgi:hypothetical protein
MYLGICVTNVLQESTTYFSDMLNGKMEIINKIQKAQDETCTEFRKLFLERTKKKIPEMDFFNKLEILLNMNNDEIHTMDLLLQFMRAYLFNEYSDH